MKLKCSISDVEPIANGVGYFSRQFEKWNGSRIAQINQFIILDNQVFSKNPERVEYE